MKKYIFLIFLACSVSMNCFSDRFMVEGKIQANDTFMKLEKMGLKIKNVENLDQQINGNILIVFE